MATMHFGMEAKNVISRRFFSHSLDRGRKRFPLKNYIRANPLAISHSYPTCIERPDNVRQSPTHLSREVRAREVGFSILPSFVTV